MPVWQIRFVGKPQYERRYGILSNNLFIFSVGIFMKLRKLFGYTTLILAAAFASGCASVKKAAPAKDAAAKRFEVTAEHAQVYVYRNEVLGAALSMPVTVDGKLAGKTGSKSFFKFDLPAGKHTLTSQDKESRLNLEVENGKIYYVWQEVKMGVMSGGSKLQLVSAEQGQKGVKECALIESLL